MTFHRTGGTTKDCRGCRYWSEMIAGNLHNGGGAIEALCLAPYPAQAPQLEAAPHRGQYVGARQTCAAWRSGYLGAVDEPSLDGPHPLEYLLGIDP